MRKQLLQLCLLMLCYAYSIAQPSKSATYQYQNQAATLLLNGQYQEAIEALELAAEAHKVAEKWPNYFSCLNQITNTYLALQNYVEAKRMAKETLWESISILGRDNNESAKSAHQLAEVYSLAGRFSRAEEYHLMGLKIRRSIYGEAHPDIADSYCKLAKNLSREKKYTEADQSYQQALTLQKNLLGENHSFVANTLFALGELSSKREDLQMAESYHQQALKIREKTFGSSHHKVAQSYFALSQIDQTASDDYLKAAADIYVLELSEASIDAAICLFQYGDKLFKTGLFDSATPYAQKAVAIFNIIGKKHSLTGSANHLLGAIYYEDNDASKAIKHFEQAIGGGFQSPFTYHLLINAHHQLDQYTQATVWAKKYAKRAKSDEAAIDALLLIVDNQLADEEWEEAQHTFKKIKTRPLSAENNRMVSLYEARLLFGQQNFDALIEWSQLSDPFTVPATLVALEIEMLRAKASIRLAQQGRSEIALLKAAYQKYDELHHTIIELLNKPLSSPDILQLNALQANIYDGAVECSYLLYEQTQEVDYIHSAFTFSEKSKAVNLSLHNQHHYSTTITTSLNQERQYITAFSHQIKDKLLNGDNVTVLKERQDVQIKKYSTQLAQFEKESPEAFSHFFHPEIVSINSFNTTLASTGMYALSYFFGEQLLYIFVIKEGKMSMFLKDKNIELQNQIDEFLRLCQQVPDEQSADELTTSFHAFIRIATILKETLIPISIEKSSPNEEQHSLLILPDEALTYFPFEALCFKEEQVSNFSQASYIGNYIATLYHYSASSYMQDETLKNNDLYAETEDAFHIPNWDEHSTPVEEWNEQEPPLLLINRIPNKQIKGNITDDFLSAIKKAMPAHKAIQYSRLAYLQANINQPLNAHPYYWAGYCFIGKPNTDYVSSNNFPYWILAAVGGLVLVGLWVRKK